MGVWLRLSHPGLPPAELSQPLQTNRWCADRGRWSYADTNLADTDSQRSPNFRTRTSLGTIVIYMTTVHRCIHSHLSLGGLWHLGDEVCEKLPELLNYCKFSGRNLRFFRDNSPTPLSDLHATLRRCPENGIHQLPNSSLRGAFIGMLK